MKLNKMMMCSASLCILVSVTACAKPKKFSAPIYDDAAIIIDDDFAMEVGDAVAKRVKNSVNVVPAINNDEVMVKKVFAYMEKQAIKFYDENSDAESITDELLKEAKELQKSAQESYKAIANSSLNPNDEKAAAEQKKIRKALRIINFARFKDEIMSQKIDYSQFVADLKKVLEMDAKSVEETGDLSLLYLCDKDRNIDPVDYEPKNIVPLVKNDDYVINKNNLSLRKDVAEALTVLARAAKEDGIKLDVSSSYRSYTTQKNTFNYWVSVDRLYEAERESARPGTSQHQLGVALDFGSISNEYAETKSGKWMYENAADYGWSLSFPKAYEDVTGFKWESWHFRYIGKEACALQKKYFNDVQQYMIEFIDAWRKCN